MLSLNKKLKLEFIDMLLDNDKYSSFYYYNERSLLSMDFDLNNMKIEFNNWVSTKFNV